MTPSENLPQVRGTYQFGAALKDLVWFRAGGAAEVLFRPADVDDLASFLANRPLDVPLSIIGVGSNLLVRDGGVQGVVIRLPAAFGKVEVDGLRLRAGAAALDSAVARKAADAGIAGLEFLRGVPGTIGGPLRMNAGCYGSEVKDIFVEATVLDGKGGKHTFSAAEMAFAYRKTGVPDEFIFVEAVFEGSKDEPIAVRTRMEELLARREISQPIGAKTGGSTFKNPPGEMAWKLIEDAGCRGLKIGDASVSEVHCNFLINHGNATAVEIEALGEEVRRRVKDQFGIELEWEIKRIGVPGENA